MRAFLYGDRADCIFADDVGFDGESIRMGKSDKERKEEKRLAKNAKRAKGKHVRYISVQVDYKGKYEVKELRQFRAYRIERTIGGDVMVFRDRNEVREITKYLPLCDEVEHAILEIRNAP